MPVQPEDVAHPVANGGFTNAVDDHIFNSVQNKLKAYIRDRVISSLNDEEQELARSFIKEYKTRKIATMFSGTDGFVEGHKAR